MSGNKQLYFWFAANYFLWSFSLSLLGNNIPLNFIAITLFYVFFEIISDRKISRKALKFSIALCTFLLLHLITSSLGPCETLFRKSLFGIFSFSTLFFIGADIGFKSRDKDWIGLVKLSNYLILISLIGLIIEFLLPDYFLSTSHYREKGTLTGLFHSEPSHFAFSIFPFIGISILEGLKSNKFQFFLMPSLCILFSLSTTMLGLLLSLFSWLAITQKKIIIRIIFLVSLILTTLLLFTGFFPNKYQEAISGRIEGFFHPESSDNLSGVVLNQGWIDLITNIKRSYGFGIGFNRMGCDPSIESEVREIIQGFIPEGGLNNFDGSFMISKLISDLGFFAVLFLSYLFFLVCSSNKKNTVVALKVTVLFIILSSFFIRSGGYFSCALLLLIPIVFSLKNKQC